MRFVSPNAKYGIQLKEPVMEIVTDRGVHREIVKEGPLVVQFWPWREDARGHLNEHEIQAAFERFPKELAKGMPAHDDSILVVDGRTVETQGVQSPIFKLGVFDTENPSLGWTDETRLEVEDLLMNHADIGRDFIHVPAVETAAPFPTWDDMKGVRGKGTTAERLAETVKDMGLDVNAALAYEQTHQNREDVIDALLGLVGSEEVEPDGETVAA